MKNPSFILLLLSSLLLSSPFCFAGETEVDDEHPFTYTPGPKGPENWARVNSSWHVCNTGKQQSPIDLQAQKVKVLNIKGKLTRTYKPALAQIVNRGHDIAVKWEGDAGKLIINGTEYNLQQCHWHSPSEHTMNGKKFAMEMHIVHMTADGKIAVIGVLYKLGAPDPFLATLVHRFKTVTEKGIHLGVVNPRELKFGSLKYYRYIGSLTIPPCTEGVTWTIAHKVRTVSMEQLREIRAAVHDGYKNNARPVQELKGRSVHFYNTKYQ